MEKKRPLNVLTGSILFSILIINEASIGNPTCKQDDLTLPRRPSRICEPYPNTVYWLSGCDEHIESHYSVASACQAYVGMTVIVKCQPVTIGQNVEVLKDNRMKNNSGTLTLTNVQHLDAGEYECRTSSVNGTLISSVTYNISISTG